MVPSLRDMCKTLVFKYGIGPRNDLPGTLPAEIDNMETAATIDISGRYYADYHIAEQHACEIDIEWSSGVWSLGMRHNRARHEAQIRAGGRTYLGHEWRKIFLFAGEGPFPGCQVIVVFDFDMRLHRRSVHFYGRFYNQYSGNMVSFKTEFSFSITSHYMKVQTEFLIGETFTSVGRRFLKQPDTPYADFFRYID